VSVPAASVIVPTFNRRAMVCEAIASVFAQTEKDFQLIVVDDGSSDGTWDRLQAIASAFAGKAEAMCIERTAQVGPAGARNHGIAMARGQYTAFLDSDDLWAPRKVARQVEFMRTRACEISQTQEAWFRDASRVNPRLRHRKKAGDIFAESLRTCLISPSAVMIETRLLKESGGFDSRMRACEDYDLWLRLLVDHKVDLLDEELVTRRAGHCDQLSATTPAPDRFRILALAKLIAGGRLSDEQRGETLKVLAEKCVVYGAGLRKRGRTTQGDFFVGIASERSTTSFPPDQALVERIASSIGLDHESSNRANRRAATL
jgi:glycosyltransferase involved in cell wall biosynthesis